MTEILRHPETLIAFIVAFGILGNFWLAGRELAINLSLRRNGIVGEASTIRLDRPIFQTFLRRNSPRIVYKFFDPNSERYFQRTMPISYQRYRQLQIGDAVSIIMLGHNPHLSRLADDASYGPIFFAAGAVSLIFPVYFFGWGSLPACLVFILTVFAINWLWINFRPI